MIGNDHRGFVYLREEGCFHLASEPSIHITSMLDVSEDPQNMVLFAEDSSLEEILPLARVVET